MKSRNANEQTILKNKFKHYPSGGVMLRVCYNYSVNVSVKRIYDVPSKSDGTRVLVDRLWPRGVVKEHARIDMWAKEVAPSTELRKWYHAKKKGRLKEFHRKYKEELLSQKKTITQLFKGSKKVSLITSVRDVEQSHIPVLEHFLKQL